MGNQKSDPRKQLDIEINHPRLLKSKIVTEGTQKRLQTVIAIDEKEYDKWKTATNKYTSTPTNLFLPLQSSFSRTAMCGHTGNATVQYDNYPYLLTEEIYNRRGKKSRFTEVEMWFLLHSLVKARNQAQSVGEHLGDIRPRNIFLNEDAKIRVANSLSWPLEVSNIQKTMDKISTYLAPQDLIPLSKNQYFEGPTEIGEAFSVGLTVLSAGNLMDYEDLYDLKTFGFDGFRFNQALAFWRGNNTYSEVLRGTVLSLCELDVSKRMTIAELNGLLGKHQQSIEQRANFVVDNAPQKLHQEIMSMRQNLAFLQQGSQPFQNVYQQMPVTVPTTIPVSVSVPEVEVNPDLKKKGSANNAVQPKIQ